MAKVNTLFSYFAKTPSPKTAKKNELKRSEVLSPHKNGNTISGKTASTNKIKAKPKSMEESSGLFTS